MTVNVDDRGTDAAEVSLMRRYGEKSVLMLPLVFQGATIGLLEACDREQLAAILDDRSCASVGALAGQAAVALHNARLFGSVQVAETEMALFCDRLQKLAEQLARVEGLRSEPAALPALAEAVRTAFGAHSCVMARRGQVVGAAVTTDSVTTTAASEPHAWVVGNGDVGVEVTLVMPAAATPAETRLLELAATIAARLAG